MRNSSDISNRSGREGCQFSVVDRRIPILRGNAYLYEAEEVTLQR